MKHSLLLRTLLLGICCWIGSHGYSQWNPTHAIGTIDGTYQFRNNQVPSQLVELYPASYVFLLTFRYQWEQSTKPESEFTSISGATGTSYSFTAPLTQTMYFRRKTSWGFFSVVYSNVVKLQVVSQNWEDLNYIREHDVNTSGVSTWQAVDLLPIGQKLQSTTYMDGLGRAVETVSRETATPGDANSLWGDVVQFSLYDQYGREAERNLPYTTTTASGKYKANASTEQPQYYTSIYNETPAFTTIQFDGSPLNRAVRIKEPGTQWAASSGKQVDYGVNTLADEVHIWAIDYVQGNAPIDLGVYVGGKLYKLTYIDENNKQVIEYTNTKGQLILKKVQLDDAPSGVYQGWICTYNVYDDFGLLRCQIQPEAVNYLLQNNWSFASANGLAALNGWCFQYFYDEKGRNTWKRNPGAEPLRMLYDVRDRLVLTQDGNQAAMTTPQWTATVYDELDRPVLTTLYNTSKSIPTLQSDIAGAASTGSVTLANPANTGGYNYSLTTSYNPLSFNDLNTTTITTVLKYLFYDGYSVAGVKGFDGNYTNLSAYNTTDPNVQSIGTSKRTLSMVTSTKTRVMGTYNFLNATHYYDERGSLVQTLSDNIKSGVDITTLQYHFDGRLLSTCSDHTTTGTGYTNFKILTKYQFDKLGRVTSIQKQYGTNALKSVSKVDYDDMGRIKVKHLSPEYANGAGLEHLAYSYNIHNQLTGINKDYALKTPSTYDKWGHFFGMYLGYDNRDGVLSRGQLNGQVSGVVWNSLGDDAQRRYEYSYDNAGRLSKADYTEREHAEEVWSNAKMDFSVSGANGKVAYDLNGNLLSLLQKGVMPGSAPATIDQLEYRYFGFSNQLKSVTDQMTQTNINGKAGDFKDGSNGLTDDYVYDANGNVVVDLNKNLKDIGNTQGNGIRYNHLDKPEFIRIAGKGTVQIVYSGDGEKLQRIYTPEGGTALTTTYAHGFVYQSSGGGADALTYINFEEGRVRVIDPIGQDGMYDALSITGSLNLPNGKQGAFDYFITDYQQNVRMVLTEEGHVAEGTCTMESTRAQQEEPVFGQTGGGNEVAATRYATPAGWQSGEVGSSVSRLGNLAGHTLGPNTLQKVMAGDRISAQVLYYHQTASSGSNPNIASLLTSNLLQTLSSAVGAAALLEENVQTVTSQLNVNQSFLDAVRPSGGTSGAPKAYLTVLFFDERFKFIGAEDGGAYQQQVAATVTDAGSALQLVGLRAPKNGYCLVYVSNESDGHVYFDNLRVSHVAGNILEETHYYSFGLKIAAISSKKLGHVREGVLKNAYLYQGSFSEEDEELGWNEFALRNYDPQVGRWIQQDPYQQFASPYIGMGNDPVNIIDPSGGSVSSVLGVTGVAKSAVFMLAGAMIGNAAYLIGGGDDWKGAAVGAGVGLLASLNLSTATQIVLRSANAATSVINTTLDTRPAGGNVQGTNQGSGYGPNAGNSLEDTRSYDAYGEAGENWQPLTKGILYDYYKKNNPNVADGAIHQNVGYYFEGVWDFYASVNLSRFNYTPNPIITGDQTFKPDGISNTILKRWFYRSQKTFRNAAWYEVKAKGRGIYLTDDAAQLIEYAYQLANRSPQAALAGAAKLVVVTTSNMNIPDDIIQNVNLFNVQLVHLVAYYDYNSTGKMRIKFYERKTEYTNENDIPKLFERPVIINFK